MLLPKGGLTWKSAQSRLPAYRAVLNSLLRTRPLLYVAIAVVIILLWRGISSSAMDVQKYVSRSELRERLRGG